MDWNAAIEKNREALKRILAALVAMAGLADGGAGTLPRHLHPPCSGCCVGRSRHAAAGHRGRAWFCRAAPAAALRADADDPAQRRRHRHPMPRGVLPPLPLPTRGREASARHTVRQRFRHAQTPQNLPPLVECPHLRSRCRFSTGFRVGSAVHVVQQKACRASRCPASPAVSPPVAAVAGRPGRRGAPWPPVRRTCLGTRRPAGAGPAFCPLAGCPRRTRSVAQNRKPRRRRANRGNPPSPLSPGPAVPHLAAETRPPARLATKARTRGPRGFEQHPRACLRRPGAPRYVLTVVARRFVR